MGEWYKSFFDELYYKTYRVFEDEERNEGEARFIVEAMQLPEGARVLDLGCGYARHAVYLAKWGYRVVCLDLSDYLLERARERIREFNVEGRVDVVKGDMREVVYDSEFDGAYMFFTTFGFFDDKENSKVLSNISKSLKPGGRLLLDLWNPVRVVYSAYIHRGSRRVWYEAGDYIVLEEARYDLYNARVHTQRILLDKASHARIAERYFSVRFYFYWELEELMEKTGLAIQRLYGSYSLEEYTPTSPRMIIIAEKSPPRQ